MGKGIFVDLTRCTACRGCQIACKQWKDPPGEQTRPLGPLQNPPALSVETLRLVRFAEASINGRLEWLFFPERCRHCIMPACKATADTIDQGCMKQDAETGAVYTTPKIMEIGGGDIENIQIACPYNIPRIGPGKKGIIKCDFCFDRITNNMPPDCILACPAGAMSYGDEEKMRTLARKRLQEVKKKYPDATLGDPDSVRVIYLFRADPKIYHKTAVTENVPLTRKHFLAGFLARRQRDSVCPVRRS